MLDAGCRELVETHRCRNKVYEYFAIWSIWPQLPFFYRLYSLLLSVVVLYTLFSTASTVRRSKRLDDSPESSRIPLEAGITNLRQVLAAMFFAFGALFFSALPGAFQTIGLSRSLPLNDIIGHFSLHFAFAANVFIVFLFLHCVQWFVSSRILSTK